MGGNRNIFIKIKVVLLTHGIPVPWLRHLLIHRVFHHGRLRARLLLRHHGHVALWVHDVLAALFEALLAAAVLSAFVAKGQIHVAPAGEGVPGAVGWK